jgi:hypothetical protein
MAISHAASLSPVAFRLAAALERYQADFDELVESWFDWNRCRAVTRELDDIEKMRVPCQLAVDMMDVVMRHVELLRSLLRMATVGPQPGGVKEIETLHQAPCRDSGHAYQVLKLITREQ